MDLLYIGTLPPHPGGSAVVAGQFLPGLAARGHRVRAVSGTTEPIGQREALDPAVLPGVSTFRFPVPENITETSLVTLQSLRAERPHLRAAVRRALRSGCPEVVISGRSTFAIDSAQVARALAVPFIQIEHSRRGGGLEPNDPDRSRAVARAFDRAMLTVLVAHNLREVHGQLPPAVVVPNAVETDRFRPMPRDPAFAARWGIAPDAVVVLHASNLKPLKRALDIVAAIPAVVERVPGTRFVFVGEGVEHTALAAAIDATGVGAHALMVDWQPRDAMPDWYALADIVVMASTTEAMSMTGLETMASGRVLVASDIPAFRETVTDGVDGLLFPVLDVAALADRIATAAADPGLRARLGAAARARSLGRSMVSLVSGWEAAIASVLPAPAASGGSHAP